MAFGPLPTGIQDFLTWQASIYSGHTVAEKEVQPGPFVTISRAYGCEGIPLAERLARRLNAISPEPTPWVVMGKEVVGAITERKGEAARFVEALSNARRSHIRQTVDVLLGNRPTEYQAYETLAQALLSLAEAGRVILVGRGGAIACAGAARGYHVRLVAPLAWRSGKIARERRISAPEAEAVAVREERARESFVREFTGADATDPEHYDAVFNNGRNKVEEIAGLVAAALGAKGYVSP
ncbi:MAG: cytidylate kinase-like family protein [Candidatus Tectomicrobia bacterium]|nr:cytidylate kinase-like family protein [Candidatus Tectomicrobia bacterium]